MYCEDEKKEKKERIVELLAKGYTERALDEEDGLPCWETRRSWQKQDEAFLARCHHARAAGADYILHEAEKKQHYAYERAMEDVCSPQLVTMTENISRHARWKASKYNKEIYGDKVQQELSGPDGKPIPVNIGICFVKPTGDSSVS